MSRPFICRYKNCIANADMHTVQQLQLVISHNALFKMNKFIVLCATLAMVNAGYIQAPAAVTYSAAPAVSHVSYASPVVSYGTPAITTQQANIYRTPGNLGQISTYSKTIDTPFSSVSKSDFRVSNPGYAIASAPAVAYAAPAYHAAPAVSYASPIVTKTIASPAISYAAPALSYAAAAPVVAKTYAAPAAHGLVGVAYSAAPAVSHMTYSNGLGLTYGW